MRLLIATLGILCCLTPRVAEAFHAGSTFADPPGKGGGGDVYYTGAPYWRGWDCAMCHQDAAGKIKLHLAVEPKSLFTDFSYQSGESYTFTATLVGEHLGFEAGMSNFNGLAASATGSDDLYVGTLSGADFFSGGEGVIVSTGLETGQTSWTFTWTAPDTPGGGKVALHFGLVDGNGAESPATETRTDPEGDDVFMTRIEVTEKNEAGAMYPPPTRSGSGWGLALGFFAGAFLRRRVSRLRSRGFREAIWRF